MRRQKPRPLRLHLRMLRSRRRENVGTRRPPPSQRPLPRLLRTRTEFFYEHAMGANGRIPASEALVRKDWKYMLWPGANYEQLFDLTADPREESDLARDPKQTARLTEMRTRFAELKAAAK